MSRTMYGTGDELIKQGHTVDYWFEDDLQTAGIPPQLRRFVVPWRIVRMVRLALAAGRRYDVVEIHEPLASAYALQRSSLPPLVIFSYGLEERSRLATLDYRRRKGLPISLKSRYSPLTVVWQAAYAVRHATHVICSNSEDVEYLRQAGVPTDRLTRHHSGVESEFLIAGQNLPALAQRRGLLFLGAWLHRKGTLDLVEAANKVLAEFPQTHLTVAGCMTDESTVQQAFNPAVRQQIRVIPAIADNRRLIEVYANHAVFVLPSYFEGQPLAMIEAAALGLPIVTTNVCGMLDFVRPGENGLTVPVADPQALAAALRRLLADPALTHRLGENARQLAQQHTWSSAAGKIAAAYGRAIAVVR